MSGFRSRRVLPNAGSPTFGKRVPVLWLRWISACLLLLATPATACQICFPMPTESLADRILAAEHLMLAREHPSEPYHLKAIRILKGDPSEVPPVDVFLDSSTRRQLANNADLSLLCGWFAEENEWRRLALHDETSAPVIATILDRADAWKADPDERLRYFAGFLASEDSELSDLAHIEVAHAPYSKLLRYADRIPRGQLHEKLANLRRLKWHALYILFLSQSEDPSDHEFIRDGLADAARYGLAVRTAAFASALIEIDGSEGIARISDLYLGDLNRRPEELVAIHAALRVHGDEGRPELRDPIVAAYGSLLGRNPVLAPDLADDLTRWQRFDHAKAFATLLAKTTPDLAATTRIRGHLQAGASTTDPPPSAEPASRVATFTIVCALLMIPLLLALQGRAKAAQAA